MSEVKTNKITSLASNNDITLDPDGTGDVVVASGHKLGVGTTSPAVEAHIQTASGNPELRIESTGANYVTMSVKNSSRHYSTQIRTDQSNAYVVRDETGGANRFLIDTSGNVGISTTSPVSKLNVDSGDLAISSTVNSDGGDLGELVFYNRTNAGSGSGTSFVNDVTGIQAKMVGTGNNSGGKLSFFTKADGGDRGERMRLSETGRLEFQTITNETSQGLQSQRLDWRNENSAGVMAGIGVVRTADGNAPGAFVIRTSTNVDSSSNSGDGEISEKFRVAPNGDLTATDTSIASNSDQRLKENIADYAYDLAKFKQFQTRTFNWKQPTLHGEKSEVRGFVAQELEAIDSYWVNEIEVQSDSDDYQYLPDTDIPYGPNNIYKPDDAAETDTQRVARFAKTSKLGQKDAMYVSVIQQLIAKIETLETKVAALEAGE